jgi:fucose permease
VSSSRRTLLAALAFLAFISLGLPDGLLGVAWPSMSDDFSLPLDALGLLVAIQTAGYLLSSFLSGRLLRVTSLGVVLAVSTLAAASALLGFSLATAWPLLLGFGFLAGLAGGAVDACLNAYGATHFSARVLNWLHASFGVGTTLGPFIVTAVLSSGGVWRVSYVIVGSFHVLLALTFFLTRRRWTEVATLGATHERVDPARTRDTLRLPIVWLGMLTFYVYAGVEVVTAQWSFSLMTLQRGVPVATAGLLVGLFWGSLMVGRVLFGIVADRVPLVSTLAACMASAVLGALLFWLEPTRLVSFFGLMLIGFSVAPIFASLISLTPTRVGREHSDNAIGFQIASAGLGGASLTALVGLLATSVGLEVIGVSIVALSGALFVLFGALIRAGRA